MAKNLQDVSLEFIQILTLSRTRQEGLLYLIDQEAWCVDCTLISEGSQEAGGTVMSCAMH